jgi:putative heme-binding domain-containing protein
VIRAVTVVLFGVLAAGVPSALAQDDARTNPRQGDPQAIEQGQQHFRSSCASCHGLNATGLRGPDLTTGQWAHGGSDAQLFRTIMQGIPGTEMPAAQNADATPDQVWAVIAYLRTLVGPASGEDARGNAQSGETVFWGKATCGQCHMVRGRGGRLGPDLSRIGTARSRRALITEIRTPSTSITAGFWPVTLVARDGRRTRGVRKAEDPFSIQIMDTGERLLSVDRSDLREVVQETRSLMPDYGPDRLTDAELDDVIRYLRSVGQPVSTVSK